MSVIVKGMEMPIKCAKCPIADISAEYYFCEKIDWFGKERPSDCPLIEILTPHGRLIDADKLLVEHSLKLTEEFAPTVIEPEGEKE